MCAHCFRFIGSVEQQIARQVMAGATGPGVHDLLRAALRRASRRDCGAAGGCPRRQEAMQGVRASAQALLPPAPSSPPCPTLIFLLSPRWLECSP